MTTRIGGFSKYFAYGGFAVATGVPGDTSVTVCTAGDRLAPTVCTGGDRAVTVCTAGDRMA